MPQCNNTNQQRSSFLSTQQIQPQNFTNICHRHQYEQLDLINTMPQKRYLSTLSVKHCTILRRKKNNGHKARF